MKNKGRLIACAVMMLICFVGVIAYNYRERVRRNAEQSLIDNIDNKANENKYDENKYAERESDKEDTVIVQISGAVKNPDVYTISADARLKDLVEMAGGFTEDAYMDNLNLAEHISDAQKYVVLSVNNDVDKIAALEQNISSVSSNTDDTDTGLININTADAEELKKLKGIGEELSARIIAFREQYGDFTSIEELKEVSGVGESLFKEIEDKITID